MAKVLELHQTATDLRPVRERSSWTEDAKAELLWQALSLHDIAIELTRSNPCAAHILESCADRIDELMKRAPEAVS